jgi:hypothetical protein
MRSTNLASHKGVWSSGGIAQPSFTTTLEVSEWWTSRTSSCTLRERANGTHWVGLTAGVAEPERRQVVYLKGKSQWYPLGWSHSRCGPAREETKCFPLLRIQHWLSSSQPVTIPTELSSLHVAGMCLRWIRLRSFQLTVAWNSSNIPYLVVDVL